MKSFAAALLLFSLSATVFGKLPPPSDEAKAKAAEAAAKTTHNGKVDAFLLCKAQDKVAAAYYKSAKSDGKDVKPAAQTPPCADPGTFVYVPAAPAAAGGPAVAVAAPATVEKNPKKP